MTSLIHSPTNDDILLGWETRNGDHTGNLRLKELVKERAEEYLSSDYVNAQIMIIRQVAEELTEDGGRFLCKSVDSGDAWVEAQRDYILENIKQAFRETVSSLPPKQTSPTSTDSDASQGKAEGRVSPRYTSPSLTSMDLSRSKVSSPATVTPPARLSPESRPYLQPGLAKEILLRRLAESQRRGSVSPLDEAARRRKLQMAKMQAILLKKKQEEQQLMQLLREHQGRKFDGGVTPGSWARGAGNEQRGSLDALRASHLPAQLRLTPLGKRRQLDPLAPNRKRKRSSAA